MSSDNKIRYGDNEASSYGALETKGTTYEIGYKQAARLINVAHLSSALDFGAGAGRSSKFLADVGVQTVYAVDRSEAMVQEGRSKNIPGVTYLLTRDGKISLEDAAVGLAISFFVFIEFTTKDEMIAACAEVYRVLTDHGQFIVVTTNAQAFGHSFKTFRYDQPKKKVSGERVRCTVLVSDRKLELLDTYWTTDDYCDSLKSAGFKIASVSYPLGSPEEFPDTDEPVVAPSVVIEAIKGSA